MANDSGNGRIEIPIGFRFCPNDENLVLYLRRKVDSLPLPTDEIPENDDVLNHNPWDLPGDSKKTRYFFISRNLNIINSNSIVSGCGYWKSTGEDEWILASGTNSIIGIKNSFVFYKEEENLRTQWVMEQLCLVGDMNSLQLMTRVGNWNVCRIYHQIQRNIELGFESGEDSISSCSSGIAENVSSGELEQEADRPNSQ